MKVLLAVHHFPPSFLGGAEWQAFRIAEWLQSHGHDVRVICVETDRAGAPGEITFRDEPYCGIPVRRLMFNLCATPMPQQERWKFDNPLVANQIDAYLDEFEPDLLHLVSGYLLSGSAITTAKARGIPVVYMPMDLWLVCPRIMFQRTDDTPCRQAGDPATCEICLRQQRRRYRYLNLLTRGRFGRWVYRLGERLPLSAWPGRVERTDLLIERAEILASRVQPRRLGGGEFPLSAQHPGRAWVRRRAHLPDAPGPRHAGLAGRSPRSEIANGPPKDRLYRPDRAPQRHRSSHTGLQAAPAGCGHP